MSNVKQILIWQNSLKVRKGKIAAQCAHASLKVILDLMINKSRDFDDDGTPWNMQPMLNYEQDSDLDIWLSGKFTKIVVRVESEQELLDVYNKAKDAGLLCSLIQDAGDTEFHGVPTYTAVAVGPASSDKLQPITGHLKLL